MGSHLDGVRLFPSENHRAFFLCRLADKSDGGLVAAAGGSDVKEACADVTHRQPDVAAIIIGEFPGTTPDAASALLQAGRRIAQKEHLTTLFR